MSRKDYLNSADAPAANSLKPAVSAVIQDNSGRLLMIRRTDNGKYSIPGGGQDVGETVAQAVVREVLEETGIQVEVLNLIGIYSNPAHVVAFDDGEVRQEFSICFRAQPVGGDLRTSAESSEVQWIEPPRLDELDMHPSIRLRIDHGLSERSDPYFT